MFDEYIAFNTYIADGARVWEVVKVQFANSLNMLSLSLACVQGQLAPACE